MILYGRQVIREILKNDKRKILKIYFLKNSKNIDDIFTLAKIKKIPIEIKEKNEIRELTKTDNNQGIAAEVDNIKILNINEFLEKHNNKEKISICLLDEIEDPHNLGAIIRSCEIFGVCGIILPSKKSAPVNETVYKVSSGAVEYIDIVKVSNLNNAIHRLKESGFWIYGFDISGNDFLENVKFDRKSVLIFGNEGKGLRKLVKQNCDFLIKIRQKGKIGSLNVSNAAAIAFYDVMKQFENL